MNENDLKIELMCYKQWVNPECDLENMTKEELEEFFELYVKSESYYKELNSKAAKVADFDEKSIEGGRRPGAIYKF